MLVCQGDGMQEISGTWWLYHSLPNETKRQSPLGRGSLVNRELTWWDDRLTDRIIDLRHPCCMWMNSQNWEIDNYYLNSSCYCNIHFNWHEKLSNRLFWKTFELIRKHSYGRYMRVEVRAEPVPYTHFYLRIACPQCIFIQ